jgi:hypothetical protein
MPNPMTTRAATKTGNGGARPSPSRPTASRMALAASTGRPPCRSMTCPTRGETRPETSRPMDRAPTTRASGQPVSARWVRRGRQAGGRTSPRRGSGHADPGRDGQPRAAGSRVRRDGAPVDAKLAHSVGSTWATSRRAALPQQGACYAISGLGGQQAPCGVSGPQHGVASPATSGSTRLALQTPVCGRSSSTRRAASRSFSIRRRPNGNPVRTPSALCYPPRADLRSDGFPGGVSALA